MNDHLDKLKYAKTYYSFDDVLLAPQHSDVKSRKDVNLTSNFLGSILAVPILSAAMDTVTDSKMAIAMNRAGGLGILHRFASKEERLTDIRTVQNDPWTPVAFSIGINDKDGLEILDELDSPYVNIDVAHGDHEGVLRLVEILKNTQPRAKILAGNVSGYSGYYRLAQAGVDGIKVGIGPGAACTTRIVTGHGVPQLSAIMDCAEAKKLFPNTRLIADGGIKNSGDIVKALAAGADVVMLGYLLAGADEAPGKLEAGMSILNQMKLYRGQSTVGSNLSTYAPEGVESWIKKTGPVADTIKLLAGGIKSGLSYSGARNLKELRENAEFILVSPSTVLESNPRI